MKTQWSNIRGCTSACLDNDNIPQELLENILKEVRGYSPTTTISELKECQFDLVFLSSGYYDSGVYSGSWEDSYPEEECDERLLDYVETDFRKDGDVRSYYNLSKELGNELFNCFEDEVAETEAECD